MIEIEVYLFGRFRRLRATDQDRRLSCEPGVTVKEVKRLLSLKWRGEDSLADSVLATDDRVLPDDERIFQSVKLALLPPVCGG